MGCGRRVPGCWKCIRHSSRAEGPKRSGGTRVGIVRLAENEIEFLDGIVEAFDTVIWATGFRATFPFLDASVVDWNMAECPPLYLKMMHREAANLYFIGFFQPLGCIWRLADHQARIAALQIAGYLNRPADIVARIAREMGTRHRRFDQSTRHAIEVEIPVIVGTVLYQTAK